MAVSDDYLAYVLEQLAELGRVSSRRMFGGVGLYCDEFFFGLLDDDTLYLRVGDANRADYSARGMSPFRPFPDKPLLSMSYYETPAEVLENAAELVSWARRSVAVAMAAETRGAKAASPRGRPARRLPQRSSKR
jgi:DNA transformation protein